MDPNFAGKPKPSPMPGLTFHRRAHSDTVFDIDDIFLDDLVVSELSLDCPETPPSLPMLPDDGTGPETSRSAPTIKAHGRSLSVDAGFFDGLVFDAAPVQAGHATRPGRHVRSSSMDGYNSATSSEVESGNGYAKKAVASDRLAELALIDLKRAKRILANRQSAARSKERKTHYTSELERKVQTLQTEATNLSAQITLLQRDATGLTAENKELKLRLQAMEQQAQLRDALNEALGEELKWLRIAAGQAPNTDHRSNRGSSVSSQPQNPHYSFNNQKTQNNQQRFVHESFQDFVKRA